ncbi:MAG: hypothetical protein IJN92_11820 [Lachnospiraceae bacterium]|nr:hypothetical protein [Lachnospiraceae bacterium]
MNFLNKWERKWGKYAIPNITMYLIICYAFGYILQWVSLDFLECLMLDPYKILHGQVWRLFTWIIVPPDSLDFFTLIMLYFYYSIGRNLEYAWGTFRYNVYMISGMLFTVIGAFLMYGGLELFAGDSVVAYGNAVSNVVGGTAMGAEAFYTYAAYSFSTYYICMSMFLAYAITFPDLQVLLMMIIPIKVKVLGIIYAIMLVYYVLTAGNMGLMGIPTQVAIVSTLLNAIIFFIVTRRSFRTPNQIKRQRAYKKQVTPMRHVTKHRCAICGRTEVDSPDLEFRFCSKCEGNYEYCSEHLYTHKHVTHQS